jgi:hypothetical protein
MMASSSHPEFLTQQVLHARAFLHWAEEEPPPDDTTRALLRAFAEECYALALRNMSDYYLTSKPLRRRRS